MRDDELDALRKRLGDNKPAIINELREKYRLKTEQAPAKPPVTPAQGPRKVQMEPALSDGAKEVLQPGTPLTEEEQRRFRRRLGVDPHEPEDDFGLTGEREPGGEG